MHTKSIFSFGSSYHNPIQQTRQYIGREYHINTRFKGFNSPNVALAIYYKDPSLVPKNTNHASKIDGNKRMVYLERVIVRSGSNANSDLVPSLTFAEFGRMYVENGLTCEPCQACGNRDGGDGVGAIAVICCPLAWSPDNEHQVNQSYRRLEVAWRKGGESPADQRGQRVVGI